MGRVGYHVFHSIPLVSGEHGRWWRHSRSHGLSTQLLAHECLMFPLCVYRATTYDICAYTVNSVYPFYLSFSSLKKIELEKLEMFDWFINFLIWGVS